MTGPNVTVERIGPITTVGLYGPGGRLPMSAPGVAELMAVLDSIEHDDRVRCVVFTGREATFATGADLTQILASDDATNDAYNRSLIALTNRVDRLATPTLAVINGYALGGGLELALACDMRIARAGAQLGLPETRLGLIPGAGGTHRLPRLIGEARAKHLLLTGMTIAAEQALDWGLVSAVASADQLDREAALLARTLAGGAPLALGLVKRQLELGRDCDLYEAIDVTHEALLALLGSHDFVEGLQAFQERRQPGFLGR